MNINILGISKLKWTRMSKFKSDEHYIHYCGQESPHRQQKSPKCSSRVHSQDDRIISFDFQGKPFSVTVIQVYALINNAEELEVEWFYEDLQDLLGLTPKKMSFSS